MRVTKKEIPIGDEGIRQTIIKMRQFVNDYYQNERIVNLAKKLGTDENIYAHVVKKIKYKNDPDGIELVASPKHTILGNRNFGDCDDMSVALATLLKAKGRTVYFRTAAWKPENKAKGDDSFTHVYVVIQSGGRLIPLDVTMNDFGREVVWYRKKDWLI